MANIQISTRSRNIGIGWTNQPVQTRGGLAIQDVETPSVVGTRNQVLTEYRQAQRGNSGNEWRVAWFVDGRRVLAVDPLTNMSFLDQLHYLAPGSVVEWPLDDDEAPALFAAAEEEQRAAAEQARQWRLANGYAYPEDEE